MAWTAVIRSGYVRPGGSLASDVTDRNRRCSRRCAGPLGGGGPPRRSAPRRVMDAVFHPARRSAASGAGERRGRRAMAAAEDACRRSEWRTIVHSLCETACGRLFVLCSSGEQRLNEVAPGTGFRKKRGSAKLEGLLHEPRLPGLPSKRAPEPGCCGTRVPASSSRPLMPGIWMSTNRQPSETVGTETARYSSASCMFSHRTR